MITRRRSLILPMLATIGIAAPAIIRSADAQFFNPPMFMPAVAGFNPTSLITGAGGFWRADTGVSTSGSNVTAWADQSSFANNLANGGTAADVTFSSTGFNTSFAAVQLGQSNGTGNMKVAATFTSTATVTMFMLVQAASPSANLGWGFLESASTEVNTPQFVCYGGGSPNNWQPYSSGAQGGLETISNATPTLLGVVFDGTNATSWKNGIASGGATSFSSNLGGTGQTFGLGATVTGRNTENFACAFWGITKKAMLTADWTNLKNWSNSNWGTSF